MSKRIIEWKGKPANNTVEVLHNIARERGFTSLKDAGTLFYKEGEKWIAIDTSIICVELRAFNPNVSYRFEFFESPVSNPVEAIVEKLSDVNKILDERGSKYGKFKDHADITQTLKQSADHFLKVKHNTDLKNKLSASQHEALDMIFHKIGRILNGDPNYSDSWWDLAGYAQLVAEELDGRGR